MQDRFEHCGNYDAEATRKRRDDYNYEYDYDYGSDGLDLVRYDKQNPVRGLQQITSAYKKWAERFLSDCKLQPAKQTERSQKWNRILNQRLQNSL